jgi:uncharacterized protein YjbI with pentapeptide repeats
VLIDSGQCRHPSSKNPCKSVSSSPNHLNGCQLPLETGGIGHEEFWQEMEAETLPYAIILHRADLAGARLARADLRGAILVMATLNGADLQGADLRGANLAMGWSSRTDPRSADLGG